MLKNYMLEWLDEFYHNILTDTPAQGESLSIIKHLF